MPVEILLLGRRKAATYLGCSVEELERWIRPDRVLAHDHPATPSMRLWSRDTLEKARSNVAIWRQRDQETAGGWRQEAEAQPAAAKARRKGMRKAGALLAGKVCDRLGCTRAELDRWAGDGRLPPDGEIVLVTLPKHVAARAWLPATIEAAQDCIAAWREQDQIARIARRRKPKVVSSRPQ